MADLIKIEFKVESKEAVEGIKEVSSALKEVNKATTSSSRTPRIKVETNATEVKKELEQLDETVKQEAQSAQNTPIAITADASEAKQELESIEESLESVSDAADKMASETRAAVSSVTGASVQFPTVETAESVSNLHDVETEAEEASSAITDARAEFPDISPSTEKATNNLDKIIQKAKAAHAAVNDEVQLFKGLDEQTSKAVRHLDIMLEETQALRAELAQNGQLGIFDASNELRTLKDLDERIDQIIDATELLTDKSSNLDYGGKWAESANKDIDKLIDSYYEAIEAAEASADKQAEALEKLQAKAQSQAEAFEHAQLLKKGSLEELEEALEKYRAQLDETNKSEDSAGSLEIQKRISATEQAITRQTKAAERATIAEQRRSAELIRGGSASEHIMSEVAAATIEAAVNTATATSAAGGFRRGMAVAGASVRAFGAAVKTSLGPVGVILLLLEVATWGLMKAWEKLTGWFTKGKTAADAQAKALGAQADEAARLATEAKNVADNTEIATQRKLDELDFLEAVGKVTTEYKNQTTEIERQLRLKKFGLDEEAREIEFQYDKNRSEIELAALREGWDKNKKEEALLLNELERTRVLGGVRERQAQAEVNASNQSVEASKTAVDQAKELEGNQVLSGQSAAQLERFNLQLQRTLADADKQQKSIEEYRRNSYNLRDVRVGDLDEDGLSKIEELLKPIGYKIGDDLKFSIAIAQRYYSDMAFGTSDAQVGEAYSLIDQFGLNRKDYETESGLLNVEKIYEAIEPFIKKQKEALKTLSEAQKEYTVAQEEALQKEQALARVRSINSNNIQRQQSAITLNSEQERARLKKEEQERIAQERIEKTEIKADYATDAELRRGVRTARKTEGDLADREEDILTRQIVERGEREFNEIMSDNYVTNKEAKRLLQIIENNAAAGASRETLELITKMATTLESQEVRFQSERAARLAINARLDRMERGFKKQLIGG